MTTAPLHPHTPPPDAPPSAWSRRRRLLLRLLVAGLAASLALHLLLALAAALIRIDRSGSDAGGNRGGDAPGITVLLPAPPAPTPPSLPTTAPPAVATDAALSAAALPAVADLAAPSASDAAAPAGALSARAPFESSSLSGGGLGASFFGLEAQGRRFAYVVDISSSMDESVSNDRTKMQLLRDELRRTIDALSPTSDFCIIVFADGAGPLLHTSARWTEATDAGRLLAAQRIARIASDRQTEFGIASDGTEPQTGFELAFRLRPAPDAIYFMTDGAFSDAVPQLVDRLNASARAPIHCILLAPANADLSATSEPLLRRIARQSGGQLAVVRGSEGPSP